MQIEYDPLKREETLALRGLDMADAALVLAGQSVTMEDRRFDYGEQRFLTVGFLRQRMVIVAWTQRGAVCRVISMRKANAREIARFGPEFRTSVG